MDIKSEESSNQTQQSNNKLAWWSFGMSLFSLFGYIFIIVAFAPVLAVLYLFLHTTPSDFLSTVASIFIEILRFVTIVSGLGAMVVGILALSRMKGGTQGRKTFAILGILIGFMAILYHTYIAVW